MHIAGLTPRAMSMSCQLSPMFVACNIQVSCSAVTIEDAVQLHAVELGRRVGASYIIALWRYTWYGYITKKLKVKRSNMFHGDLHMDTVRTTLCKMEQSCRGSIPTTATATFLGSVTSGSGMVLRAENDMSHPNSTPVREQLLSHCSTGAQLRFTLSL
jgi:hypothetical protein